MIAVDDFLAAFFGPGNGVLPGGDFDGPVGRRLAPWIEPLRTGRRLPVVLPRKSGAVSDAYVICWDHAQATSLRASIEAFAAHSYAPFDGRPKRLDPADPVDGAVLRLVGRDVTYVLRPPDAEREAQLWRALRRMTSLYAARPERTTPVPRPVGRMLAEFTAALAAGNAAGSGDLLDELDVSGLSAVNVAYLRVHRLSRLGRDAEVLHLPQLGDVVASGPPPVVRDAILAAWFRLRLRDVAPDDAAFPAAAAAAVARDGDLVRALARGEVRSLSADALGALIAVAVADRDGILVASLAETVAGPLRALLLPLAPGARVVEEPAPPVTEEQAAVPEPPPGSWVEWVTRLGDVAAADVPWAEWPAPAVEDVPLATAIEAIGDAQAEDAWQLSGPFIDADDFGSPARRAARALLVLGASYDRWGPADVASMQALLEIFLRGAPPAPEYAEILDLLGGNAARWAVAGNALAVLDMVDDVARLPVGDEDARLRFAVAALDPLSRHRRRLSLDLRWLAEQLADELRLTFAWDAADGDEPAPSATVTGSVLVYSLDEGVLRRTTDRLAELYPGLEVRTAASRVGSPQLRALARHAEVVALATRCAKHAATGFIRSHATEATVVEADGAGSASLIRAVVDGIGERWPTG